MSEDGPAIAARVLGAGIQERDVGGEPARVVETAGVTYALISKTRETVITVPLSPGVEAAVVLDLRPHHEWLEYETQKRERIDVIVGDPEVDRRYHVEAAPSEMIREAFDAPVRALLVAAEACRITITYRMLRFTHENLSLALVEPALVELPRLAESFETLVKTAETTAISVDGDPYRGGMTSKALEKRRRIAALEVERMRWLKKTPMISATFIATGAAGLVGLGCAFAYLPLLYALLCAVIAVPVWFIGTFLIYLALAAVGALTGITGIYHRMGHRKYDALEAKIHTSDDS